MLDALFCFWGCITDPGACLLGAAAAVPADWWFYIGLLIGMTLGAIFDWWAIILFVISFAIRLLPQKKEAQLNLPLDKPKASKAKQRRPTIFNSGPLGGLFKKRKR